MTAEHTSEEPLHVLVLHIERDGYLNVSVECPYDSIDRPCGTWQQKPKGAPCTCACEACAADNHDDCDSEWIAEVGRKDCQCDPVNECWYNHAVAEVGTEMLRLPKEGLTFRVPAHMFGAGWDDPIDVDPVTLPSTHEVPSMTAHGSVVHHRSERGVWCRESRVFLGSDYDLSLHRCSAAADHQSADWSCTIKLVDLEAQP
jgi:hypothetical protein